MAYDKGRVEYLLALPKVPEVPEVVGELIKLNEGLVFMELKRFGLYNDNEAISFAYEALFIAIKTFDATKNNTFSTYATVCIYNKLGSYVRTLKNAPEIVSYDVQLEDGVDYLSLMESGDTADGNYLDKVSVVAIYQAVFKQYHLVKHPTQKLILDLWIDSQFKKPLIEIASKVNCSQSYVSKVIKQFRKGLEYRLKITN